MKHLYKVEIDGKFSNRWITNLDTLRVVANGDIYKAIRKAERTAMKRYDDIQAVRVTGIQQVAEVDAV